MIPQRLLEPAPQGMGAPRRCTGCEVANQQSNIIMSDDVDDDAEPEDENDVRDAGPFPGAGASAGSLVSFS